MDVLKTLAVAAALAMPGVATAHVTVEPKAATAGAYQVLRFGVGHGCGEAATTGLRITIPAGVDVARPQPKPGWKLAIERAGQRVTAIAWSGRLPADEYDEFLISTKLPDAPGPLAFAARQTCGKTVSDWAGQDPQHPAPTVTVGAAAPAPEDAHAHHH